MEPARQESVLEDKTIHQDSRRMCNHDLDRGLWHWAEAKREQRQSRTVKALAMVLLGSRMRGLRDIESQY